ncbi:MAG: YggS family pyridoxal phosphate-dependent enzyme [Acidimicrobiia bacterium]
MADIATRLSDVRGRIADAARAAGRDPSDVTLVAVSKEVDAAAVLEAAAAGQRDFGENRAQELNVKVDALASHTEPLRWHFIGRLQRNKVKTVAASVALWHSVDRFEIGEVIARYAPGARVLIQVNVGNEEQKGGCPPHATVALVDSLVHLGLHVEGLMTVPPQLGDPRRHFVSLRELATRLGLTTLSMGMSGDFETAIGEGATVVRVGTSVFGPRRAAPSADDSPL